MAGKKLPPERERLLLELIASGLTPNRAAKIAGVSAVSFVLVMARLTGLARAQAASAGREFALREFAGRLVAASEVNDVFDAAAVAVEAMIGTSTRACLLTETGGSTERVLVSVPAGFEGLHAIVIDAKRPAPTEVTFKEAFKAAMLEAPDHQDTP